MFILLKTYADTCVLDVINDNGYKENNCLTLGIGNKRYPILYSAYIPYDPVDKNSRKTIFTDNVAKLSKLFPMHQFVNDKSAMDYFTRAEMLTSIAASLGIANPSVLEHANTRMNAIQWR